MLLIETAINRYLALDPEVLDKLAMFDGKVIKLEITGLNNTHRNQNLYMLPNASGMQIVSDYEHAADTVLRGSPLALFKMGLVENSATMLLKGEVEITGDTRLGHQFKNVFSQMDIDWSEPLAQLMGDGLAYQLVQSSHQFTRWQKQSWKALSGAVSEYLQEESRDLVTDTELTLFNEAVDQIRNDVDRLQARINNISKTINPQHKK